ncbi:MAG: hypothetical protein AB1798_06165 [Spirochaetota bacterium]
MSEEKMTITLDQAQILELEEIVMDRDKDLALRFLEENLYTLLVKKRKEPHCKPQI